MSLYSDRTELSQKFGAEAKAAAIESNSPAIEAFCAGWLAMSAAGYAMELRDALAKIEALEAEIDYIIPVV